MDLSKVAVYVSTFLRDAQLEIALSSIEQTMPEVEIIVADDGHEDAGKNRRYAAMRERGHQIIRLPFDSGFGAKANAMARVLRRPYLLFGSDDFDFRPAAVRAGVEKLVTVLDTAPELSVASGRVNGARYEGWLHDEGGRVRETYADFGAPCLAGEVAYHPCELTVVYLLARISVLGFGAGQVHWHDDVKVGGGEHGAFFLALKRAGHKVVYVPGVNIQESPTPASLPYVEYRNRARLPGRPALRDMGVREYLCFDGSLEHC